MYLPASKTVLSLIFSRLISVTIELQLFVLHLYVLINSVDFSTFMVGYKSCGASIVSTSRKIIYLDALVLWFEDSSTNVVTLDIGQFRKLIVLTNSWGRLRVAPPQSVVKRSFQTICNSSPSVSDALQDDWSCVISHSNFYEILVTSILFSRTLRSFACRFITSRLRAS